MCASKSNTEESNAEGKIETEIILSPEEQKIEELEKMNKNLEKISKHLEKIDSSVFSVRLLADIIIITLFLGIMLATIAYSHIKRLLLTF